LSYTEAMVASARRLEARDHDQRVILHGISWQAFEAILAIRGDASGTRIYYLDGELELVSPSKTHEDRKKTLARLLELWATEVDVDLNGFGSWTLKKEIKEAGAEPDECYIFGPAEERSTPDLVIEIEWSKRTGLPKEEIYRRLGVRELWTLRANGRLVVRVLDKERWLEQSASRLLPGLDVRWLLSFLDIEPQSAAVRALRDALRKKRKR
jgi:Uma2 family endonuclease